MLETCADTSVSWHNYAKEATITLAERNALVEQYLPLVQRIVMGLFAIRNIPQFIDAEDVIQECSVKLISEVEGYDPSRGANLTTYLHWVIRRDAIDIVRKQFHRGRYQMYFDPPTHKSGNGKQNGHRMIFSERDTDPNWLFGIKRSDMKRVLTKKQLDAVEAVYIYGFTQERAARKLGLSRQSVDTHLRRAIKKLTVLSAK